MLRRFVDERSDEYSGLASLRRLELNSRTGITREEWHHLRAKVDEVVLKYPAAVEEEYTDEDDD